MDDDDVEVASWPKPYLMAASAMKMAEWAAQREIVNIMIDWESATQAIGYFDLWERV